METGVCKRFPLKEGVKPRRMVRSQRVKDDRISIHILELMAIVATANVTLVRRRDRPDREGATVLVQGGTLSAALELFTAREGEKRK